jgi:serine/threonine protein kinase
MRVEIEITAGPARGQHFTFDEPDRFLFGRAVDARISLPKDPYVSRQHFLLEISPPDCKITDLDSKNGVFVNGVRYGGRKPPGPGVIQAPNGAQDTYLQDGDEIIVGETRMKVSIQPDIFCGECGRKLSLEEKDGYIRVGNIYLCSSCHQNTVTTELPHGSNLAVFRIPEPVKREVRCIRCHNDVTDEVGLRGQEAKVEYVCKSCREKEVTDPLGLLEEMLKVAVAKKAPPGAPVIQRYYIEKEIARGGMGMIYKATDMQTGQPVAIKTMLPHVAVNPDSVRIFQREIEITRQLNHPNIVRLIDYGDIEGTFYFVLEFVDGTDLYQLTKSKGGRLSLDEALPILLGTLDGLAYAHQAKLTFKISEGEMKTVSGIVHRDLKPQNMLLAREGNQWIPKISDFGTSKSFESAGFTDITTPGDVLGTPMYWPREQITHYKYLDPATDVFSIAAVFYEVLTGACMREGFQAMFDKCRQYRRIPTISDYVKVIANNPAIPMRNRDSDIPEPVARVFDRALQETEVPYDETKMRDVLKELRYPDASAFRDALVSALEEAGLLKPFAETPQTDQSLPGDQEFQAWFDGQDIELQSAPQEPQLIKEEHPDDNMPEQELSSFGTIMYSIMQPASSREVALLVLDLERSSEYLHEVGDTYFSNLMGSLYRRIKSHRVASDLIFLKTTGDGFLAVFHTVHNAFLVALEFLKKPILQNIHIRMALHWGTVKTGPDGDVLGAEVHRVFRIEGVQIQDQIEPVVPHRFFPVAERILATKQVMNQLNQADRTKFEFAGKFRLRGFKEHCEIWMLSK